MATKAANLSRIVVRLLRSPRGISEAEVGSMVGQDPRTVRNYFSDLTNKVPELRDEDGPQVTKVTEGDSTWWRLRATAPLKDDAEFIARLAALQLATQSLAFMRGTALAADLDRFCSDLLHRAGDRTYQYKGLCEHIDRKLFFLSRGEKNYSANSETVAVVLKAVLESKKLRFSYPTDTEPGGRTVKPLSLLVWHGALYVLAKGSGSNAKIATYSVDRLTDVKLLGERFNYPSGYSPTNFTEGSFGLYEDSAAAPVEVELLFTEAGWRRLEIRERRWHKSQKFEDLADGRLRMTFRVRTLVDVIPWVRSFGAAVTVVAPVGLLAEPG